jgi:RNA recognition motif-containing protein
MVVFVGNLPYEVTQEDLKEVFAEYGKVRSVRVPTDPETGKVRGFAFVELNSAEEENSVIETLDGAEWMGRTLKVSKARPRENKNRFSSREPQERQS